MSKFDQAKLVMQLRKVRKQLAKEVIEIEGGDGAVVIEINGEQKIKRIHIDPERIDLDNIEELEQWLEEAIKKAIHESQQKAAEKMKPYMGQLGNLGF